MKIIFIGDIVGRSGRDALKQNIFELKVVDTPPGVKGDTAAGATKPAVLETGLTVNVPFFVNNGEAIRVDTRTGQYLERAG